MSIGQNIKTLRREQGLSQEALAKKVGVSRVRITQLEGDPNTQVKDDTLLGLAKALGCLPEHLKNGWHLADQFPIPEAASFSNIPILNVELAAGIGKSIDLEEIQARVPISSEWLMENQLNEASLAVVKVSGDSMMPRLMDGDMLLLDTSDTRPVSGKVYAIATEDELRVKRLLKRTDGNWVISSDNKSDPTYQDEIIAAHNFERLRILGRAVKVLMGDI